MACAPWTYIDVESQRRQKMCRWDGRGFQSEDDHQMCVGCMNEKLLVNSFPKSKNSGIKTSRVLELIHSDVMGTHAN